MRLSKIIYWIDDSDRQIALRNISYYFEAQTARLPIVSTLRAFFDRNKMQTDLFDFEEIEEFTPDPNNALGNPVFILTGGIREYDIGANSLGNTTIFRDTDLIAVVDDTDVIFSTSWDFV